MHRILGTAGHIDHGKSTLVKALTGTDPDRLPEEKKRGVTIELGFAHLSLPAPGGETFEIGVVDVPGHADFVNNMVAGVAPLDLALFVVAADDAWMPQSEEHLQILSYLGITNYLIALTKADLVEDLDFVAEILREDLVGTVLENAEIIPVSAPTGQGLPELKAAIARKLAAIPPPGDFGKPRLSIDRIFSPKGVGTVVTGTLTGGNLSIGDTLTALPGGLKGHLRAIQNHNSPLETALPGMRTALNLPDLPPATRGKAGLHRGDLLLSGKITEPHDTIDVEISRSARPIPSQKSSRNPLRTNRRYLVHHGAGHTPARLVLAETPRLQPGETSLAQLRFETPIHLLTGERLVIRDLSRQSTLAGATVLDPRADRQRFRSDSQETFLKTRAAAPGDPAVLISSLLTRDRLISANLDHWNLPFAEAKLAAVVKKLEKAGRATVIRDQLAETGFWKELTQGATASIRDFHRHNPDLPGLPTENLRRLSNVPAAFETLLEWLAANQFSVRENLVAHRDHSLELPPGLEKIAAEILQSFETAGLNPPSTVEAQNTPEAAAAFKFLLRTNRLLALEPKVTLAATAYAEAREKIILLLQKNTSATASELRQHLGTSRKVVMPLLEKLDREKVTRREGDLRFLV